MPRRFKRIILHIGDRKTGTTAIQSALSSGGVATPGVKICYPAARNLVHNYLAVALVQPRWEFIAERLFWRLKPHFPDRPKIGYFLNELKNADGDIVVISAEQLEQFPVRILANFIEARIAPLTEEFRIVCYVRPHGSRLVSNYAEAVKIGFFGGSQMEWYEKRRDAVLRYTPRLAALRKVFGQQFTVRTFSRGSLFRGDIVADFYRFILDSEDFTLPNQPPVNSSLGLPMLAIARSMHEKLNDLDKWHRHALGWEMQRLFQDAIPELHKPKVKLESAVAHKIRHDLTDDAIEADAMFFPETRFLTEAMNSICDDVVEASQSLELSNYFSQQEQKLINAFAQLTTEMYLANPEMMKLYLQRLTYNGQQPNPHQN